MANSTSTTTAGDTGRGLSAGDTGRRVMERVRDGATQQLSAQKTRATDGLGTLAQAVRQSTQCFREHNQDTVAQYVERAADQLEQFSTRLRDRDVTELVNDVQRFARQQPAVFVGAAFAAGLVAARFLKSSSRSRGFDSVDQFGRSAGEYGGRSSFATEGTAQYARGGL